MNDTTSILDLPTDPVGGGSISNNMRIKAQELSNAQSSQDNLITNQQINSNSNSNSNSNNNSSPGLFGFLPRIKNPFI